MTTQVQELLTREQVAERLQVHIKTVEGYQRKGLPCVYLSQKIIRYDWEQVWAWIQGEIDQAERSRSERKGKKTAATLKDMGFKARGKK